MDVRARLQDAAWSVHGSPDLPERAQRRYVRRRAQRISTSVAFVAAGTAVLVAVLGIGPLERSQPTVAGKPVAVEHIDDAYFVDSLHAVAVVRGADPLVAETGDGGRTWTSVGHINTDIDAVRGRVVVFLNEHDGLVWGDGELHTTDDGGESWTAVDGTFLTIGASRVDESVWSLTGCRTDADDCIPGVARSTDGGESWTPTKEAPKLRGGEHQLVGISQQVAYVLDGIAGSKAAVWRTDDGGASWTRSDGACLGDVVGRSSGPIRSVLWQVCPNVVGSTPQPTIAWRSFDGGKTWASAGGRAGDEAPSGGIADFKALSDQRAVIALDGGAIYSTIDGGESWQHTYDLPAGSHPLLGVRAGMQVWAFTTASSPVHGLWVSRDGVGWARIDG